MAEEIYGPAFEIHGGGLDLVFPHHENEVAQSRALGHPFATIWAHNGLLRFTGEKMSKSIGNVTTLREALDTWGREVLLVFFLTASWRKPIDFSDETLGQAAARLETLRNAFTRPAAAHDEAGWAPLRRSARRRLRHPGSARGHARLGLERPARAAAARSRRLRARVGSPSAHVAPADVAELAARRAHARRERDFETSDRLRDELAALGWVMRDGPDGGYDLVRA